MRSSRTVILVEVSSPWVSSASLDEEEEEDVLVWNPYSLEEEEEEKELDSHFGPCQLLQVLDCCSFPF